MLSLKRTERSLRMNQVMKGKEFKFGSESPAGIHL